MKNRLLRGLSGLVSAAVLVGAVLLLPEQTLLRVAAASSLFALPEGVTKPAASAPQMPLPPPVPAVSETSSQSEKPTVSQGVVDTPTLPPSYTVEEENRAPVVAETFSAQAPKNAVMYGLGCIRNDTKKTAETVMKLLQTPWGTQLADDPATVQVLIMHTHTTESYEPYERDYYDKTYAARTTDEHHNMAAIGERLAERLRAAGIGVVHDTTAHDYPAYSGAYDRSAETVKAYLKEYPTIKVVLDIHRDALERTENGETVRIKPVATIDGKNAAQLMIIAGCDDGTMNMPTWEENLRFAAALQHQLQADHPGLARPVMFCYRKYNQNLTTGSLLVEVGGHANTREEALYAADLLAESLVTVLNAHTSPAS